MRVHYLQHVDFEGPADIMVWAKERGHTVTKTLLFDHHEFPPQDSFDFLVIMGGPMSVYDEKGFPWLKQEKEFIREAIKNKKIIIGLCLGAQLIAEVLGAKVYPHDLKEIGWHPVLFHDNKNQFSFLKHVPSEMLTFHWHGDTFDLPKGAVHFASSEGCKNQGFVYQDRVVGLQYHWEFSESDINRLIERDREQLVDGQYIQSENEILSQVNQSLECQKVLFQFLDKVSNLHI